MPVLSLLVNYWRGNYTASPPGTDQSNFSSDNHQDLLSSGSNIKNGETEIMKTRHGQVKEVSNNEDCNNVDKLSLRTDNVENLPHKECGVASTSGIQCLENDSMTVDLNNNDKERLCQKTLERSGKPSHLLAEVDTKEAEITSAMEEEENAIHEETSKEQREMMQKAEQEWSSIEDKQRYLRLQHLLEKSYIYCQFLLERMEKQKKDAQKQQERLAKKLEKKKKDEYKTTEQVAQMEGRVTRRAQKKLPVTSKSPRSDQTVQSRKKQGVRRKAQDSEAYMITEYLDRESLAKRQKLMEEGDHRDSDNSVREPTSLQREKAEINGEWQDENMQGNCSSDNEEKSTTQPLFVSGGTLRPYQLKGLAWLKVLYENGMNGILADEMGLGKTLQCISMLAFLIEMGVKGPFLIAAPLSTLPNWVQEFQKFAPKIPVVLYHGSQEERLRMRYQLYTLVAVEGDVVAFPVVVTSYEICMRDQRSLHSMDWKYIIVDEGHRIKNLNCKLIRELKTYKAANRLLLTGTPLQNNLSELWSLLNFLLPDIFDDLESFQRWFDFSAINEDGGSERIIEQEREHQVLERLHAILTPFLLRRLKSDVELSLPPKKEVLVYAPLTQKQETLYKAALDGTLLDIVGDKESDDQVELSNAGRPKRKGRQDISYKLFYSENVSEEEMEEFFSKRNDRNVPCKSTPSSALNIRMTNILMLLRKCCNHPYLLECPLEEGTLLRKVDEELVTCSGKMLLLDRMLPVLKRRGHKVLIFSQMTSMMDIIEDYCIMRNYGYSRLDGQMKVSDRQQEIKKFEVDPSVFVFLLSTRAGGLGLNLAMADTAIIYDSDWNPQVDLQAQDRCHRIGQTKPVVVYRFVTTNTVDQKIVERASTKRKLEKMIIHKGKFKGNRDSQVIDAKELRELLASGDHDSIVSSDGLMMSNRDLEALLDRSDLHSKGDTAGNTKRKRASKPTHTNSDQFFRVLDNTPSS